MSYDTSEGGLVMKNLKLLLIGDSAVGKTSLLLRYTNDTFRPSYITTIGIDYKFQKLEIDGQPCKLCIWDTAGQERFRTITLSYFRGAHGIVMVYDITDRRSFEAVRHWMSRAMIHAHPEVDIIVVGNKCDLEDESVVAEEEGRKFAAQYGVHFMECSAKSDVNVDRAFLDVAQTVMARLQANDHVGALARTVKLLPTLPTKQRKCC